MQPPLTNGAFLQNRFRITQILGQGGFGRTYHALDEQRFNEQCAVKEYIPIHGNTYFLEKSKELFQREAETLYQIQHPQIPQFRALFEEDGRLFFVQDFIQGITYSQLLRDRLTQKEPFSEIEVLQFLNQILPVISYIHGKNLIHRDISPDNLILRDRDRLPVLIDFGVVKLAQSLGQSSATEGTSVSKSGYSPIEQLKTGKAYPSSDLYALAVTTLVLLTGKHPEYLFDEMTVSWCWSKYLPDLNPQLIFVLERMLCDRPQQRYQSAEEVLIALAPLLNFNTLLGNSATAIPISQPNSQPNSQLSTSLLSTSLPVYALNPPTVSIQSRSKAATIAKTQANADIQKNNADFKKSHKLSLWMIAIALTVVISAIGILIFSSATKKTLTKSTSTVSRNSEGQETISLIENSPLQISGVAIPNKSKSYSIEGNYGKGLTLKVLSGKISNISILHPDGTTPPNLPNLVEKGIYFFPYPGIFTITVKSTEETNFTLEIVLIEGKAPEKPPSDGGRPPDRPPTGTRPSR